MDSSKLNENACRICLKHGIKFNWNDEIFDFCGISYKDCYYKYTRLKEYDSDSYPTSLCEMCAKELRAAHILFVKALESFEILQGILKKNKQLEPKYIDSDICDNLANIKCEVKLFGEVGTTTDDSRLTGNEYETISSPFLGNEILPNIESDIKYCKEIKMNEDVTIQPAHFIDIQNLKSFAHNELPQSPIPVNNRNKRKKFTPLPVPVLETYLSEASNSKTSANKRTGNKRRGRHHSPKTLVEQETDVTLLKQIVAENSEIKSVPLDTGTIKKSREKYLLMCAYCSLKVEGACKLAKHEATHSENRKRTEACPKCGIKLYTKLSLSEHMKIHDENRQKNHKCEFCEKAFFNKGALNVHRRIHLGLMVKCKICSKDFFRQVDLDKHLLKHSASPLQKNVGKKKYAVQCQYCNKSVLTDKFKEHVAAHMDQPQVKCKICDKNFFSRSKCTKHLRQVHHKKLSEYEEFIHYYVDRNQRMSSLMMKQKFTVQPLTE